MITELTKEQTDQFEKYRDYWINIGLSTSNEPINEKEVYEIIKQIYNQVELPAPESMIVLDSPYSGCVGSYLLSKLDDVPNIEQFKLDIANTQPNPEINGELSKCGYGLHDANWLSFYHYFYEVCNLDCCTPILPFCELAKHIGWWWPFDKCVIVTPKPSTLFRDSEGRLDADGKMAISYRDGWGIYACHGVRLPEKYGKVLRQWWKAEWLLKEENAEIRRTIIEQIGYEKICKELDAKTLDKWREYELLKIENVDVEPVVMVKMTCPSTGKPHAHRVPPDITSAREAITWVNHGIDPEEFVVER